MEMLRSLSTRKISRPGVYDESTFSLLGAKLKRSTSVPYYAPSIRLGGGGPAILEELPRQKSKKTTATGKFSHPIFSLFDGRRRNNKKKATAKPEFSRYAEYLREGGMWDSRSNTPIIYFK
ncbi:hypothetical protein EUTSA_v10023197mg [Eutrema salsugineum]|uniref:Uncharacterized protein n=1 Tax=Eutrema salsugineum TaxID=72664 RepID=V4M371_EUTSA|nr:uncharacterized protein LOC18026394 [Eutrema salsugineum]ESQ50634.1 hypothetical protein EUTSA_v10023197mg [Eutrema salsugineum]